jgi:creatinine amidohydrolase
MQAPWRLAELNLDQVRQSAFTVAVVPLGATEPHNLHLPYACDTLQVTQVGDEICQAAWQRGARVVLVPTIPYGTETNMRRFPLALNVNPSTLQRLVEDLVESLVGHGILKIVLLNGHGGNDLKPFLRELYGRSRAHLFLCNWYQVIGDQYGRLFADRDDHAGELETSMALAWFPQHVARHADGTLAADAGTIRPTRFEAVNRGWVSITRPWHLLTTNSGAGNPHAASAVKGKQAMDLVVERLAPFLVELAAAPLDETFPF